MPSRVDAESLLAVDVGSINTRAALFDVVAGRYRFVAAGVAPTTAGAPYHNIGEGVRLALDQLRAITGRAFVAADESLIMPATADGSGVDSFVATLSAGEPVTVVAVGLLEDVSLESARRLAQSTYTRLLECFSLNDRRRTDTRLNMLVQLRPDLILAAGGTDDGATQSVMRLMEAVGLAGYLASNQRKQDVLFAGNQSIRSEIESTFQGYANLHFAPNVRPRLDAERLDPAHAVLARVVTDLRARQIPGVTELNTWTGGNLTPTASAFGRMIRFLSKELAAKKGVLGVDVGASATTLAVSHKGELELNVFTQLGLGRDLPKILNHTGLADIQRWLLQDVSEDALRNYLHMKARYPATVPATIQDLEIEQALARQAMACAARIALAARLKSDSAKNGILPGFDAIVASGSVLAQAPTLAQATMMLLDGLQPTGVATLVLDQNQIIPALGAAAALNPLMVVQVLESSSFLHLGTVICPISHMRPGSPVLRIKMTLENGSESSLEVKQGGLHVLPLALGETARLQIQPLHRADVGMGAPGRGGGLKVIGGALGVIVDARGRPLILPQEFNRRQELMKKWLWTLGGQ